MLLGVGCGDAFTHDDARAPARPSTRRAGPTQTARIVKCALENSSRRRRSSSGASASGMAIRASVRSAKPAAPLVGSGSSPATVMAPMMPTIRARRGQSKGTVNSRRVSRWTATSIARYEAHRAIPAPDGPSGSTSRARPMTLTASPTTAAGKVRVVTFARPAMVTKTRNSP